MRYTLLFWAVFLILSPSFLHAQSQTPVVIKTLSQELENYQKQVQDRGLSGTTKKAAWLALAKLQTLSGDYASAAGSYTEAAFSVSANRDDRALFQAALCYLYAGDFEHAQSHVKTLLLTSRDNRLVGATQRLGLLIDAFKGESSALQSLEQLVQDTKAIDQKTPLLYILYIFTGNKEYADMLTKGYGASLETALLDGKSVVFKYSPLWLFGFFDSELQSVPDSAANHKKSEKENPEDKTYTGSPPLQVGLFSKQGNAQHMLDRLQQKGFKAEVLTRVVSNTTYWVVIVPGGANYNKTIMQLKDAGFEAFPFFPEK